MKTLKLLFVIMAAVLCLTFVLTACSGSGGNNSEPPHSHADVNDDLACDGCGEEYDDGRDHYNHTVENGACTVCGVPESTPGFEYRYHDGGFYVLTGYGTCTESDIVIGIYNGLDVGWVDTNAFYGCTNITSVVIADGVTHLAMDAFEDCTGLKSVSLPKTLNTYSRAFDGCKNLETVTMASGIKTISSEAFKECSMLSGITIPNTVESIENDAFLGCYRLAEVINHSALDITAGSEEHGGVARYARGVHDGETRIVRDGDYVFYKEAGNNALVAYLGNAAELTLPSLFMGEPYQLQAGAFSFLTDLESIVLPEGITSVTEYAFYENTALKHITLPEGITEIGACAFYSASALEYVKLPSTVKSIENRAFHSCGKLEAISINDGCESIGEMALYGCYALRSLYIPEGVTTIGRMAFANAGLYKIFIPNSVLNFGEEILRSNAAALTIYVAAGADTSGWAENWNPDGRKLGYGYFLRTSDGFIYSRVTENNILDAAYIAAYEGWATDLEIPDYIEGYRVTRIEDYAFAYRNCFERILSTGKVGWIGSYAFMRCENLKVLILGDSVTELQYRAFADCYALEVAYMSRNITKLNNDVFKNSSNLHIYCWATEKPGDWAREWNSSNAPVEWGYRGSIDDLLK